MLNNLWADGHSAVQGCNFAHVLGLYRMSDEAGQAFYLRSQGALADLLLWAIFRLQTRVFASNTYTKCGLLPLLPRCLAVVAARPAVLHSLQSATPALHRSICAVQDNELSMAPRDSGAIHKGQMHPDC